MPDGDAPPLTIVDYSAIDSGLGGPPFPVSVVGIDRLQNWYGLSASDYNARRDRWREALVAIIDREFPGFASKVTTCVFNTASSMSTYLNAPEGAIYGFAPLPPSSPIWKGWDAVPENTNIQSVSSFILRRVRRLHRSHFGWSSCCGANYCEAAAVRPLSLLRRNDLGIGISKMDLDPDLAPICALLIAMSTTAALGHQRRSRDDNHFPLSP